MAAFLGDVRLDNVELSVAGSEDDLGLCRTNLSFGTLDCWLPLIVGWHSMFKEAIIWGKFYFLIFCHTCR
jgi:hypothetical protein